VCGVVESLFWMSSSSNLHLRNSLVERNSFPSVHTLGYRLGDGPDTLDRLLQSPPNESILDHPEHAASPRLASDIWRLIDTVRAIEAYLKLIAAATAYPWTAALPLLLQE
jgi:hypothetical protein